MARPRSGMTELTLPPGVRSHRIEPLMRRVERNRLKTAALVAGFSAIVALFLSVLLTAAVLVLAGAIAAEWAPQLLTIVLYGSFPVSLAGVSVWVLSRLARSEHVLLARLGARPVPKGELMRTKSVLKDMAIAAGFAHAPPLRLIEVDTVNAFALGRSYDRAVVGVTRGLVDRLTADEQRAVFGSLCARIRALDTLPATAVSTLMGPIWRIREHDLKVVHHDVGRDDHPTPDAAHRAWQGSDSFAGCLPVYGLFVFATELLSWGHQESAWLSAEKSDAEGMLLLKDPVSAMRALERVLRHDNYVPSAGDAYSQLFYCWAGFGFAPEDDPEFRRVSRLQEILGVDALIVRSAPNLPAWPTPPPPPRLDEDRYVGE